MISTNPQISNNFQRSHDLILPQKILNATTLHRIKSIFDNCSIGVSGISKIKNILVALPLHCMKSMCSHFNEFKNNETDHLIEVDVLEIIALEPKILLAVIKKIVDEQLGLLSSENDSNIKNDDANAIFEYLIQCANNRKQNKQNEAINKIFNHWDPETLLPSDLSLPVLERHNLKRIAKTLLNKESSCNFLHNLSKKEIIELCQDPMENIKGDYFFEKTGSYGTVIAYKHNEITFAIKVGVTHKVLNDWKIGKNLDHPNFLKMFFHLKTQNDNDTIIFMEFIEGKDTWGCQWSHTLFPKIVKQLTEALQHLLELEITPKDMKENNMLITNEGVLKLIDFGEYKQSIDFSYFKLNIKNAFRSIIEPYLFYCSRNDFDGSSKQRLESFQMKIDQEIANLKNGQDIKIFLNGIYYPECLQEIKSK